MLKTEYARRFWRRFASADPEWLTANVNLVARAVMLVYRREGRQEARVLVNLVRCAMFGL